MHSRVAARRVIGRFERAISKRRPLTAVRGRSETTRLFTDASCSATLRCNQLFLIQSVAPVGLEQISRYQTDRLRAPDTLDAEGGRNVPRRYSALMSAGLRYASCHCFLWDAPTK
jgi:hypothetical protein